jgi:hypothetical protein
MGQLCGPWRKQTPPTLITTDDRPLVSLGLQIPSAKAENGWLPSWVCVQLQTALLAAAAIVCVV